MTDLKIETLRSQGERFNLLERDPTATAGGRWRTIANIFGASQTQFDFSQGATNKDTVTVAVVDGSVLAASVIQVTISVTAGRASDEMEMDPVIASVGAITPGVGYDVVVCPANISSKPHGTYLVNTLRL